MKHPLLVLSATTLLGLSTISFAAEDKPGEYNTKSSLEHTTPGGTVHSYDKQVDVDVDDKGRVNKTTETKTKVDPEGLMNTKEDATTTEYEEKPRGGYKQTTIKKHTDDKGANVTIKTTTDVDVAENGEITTTAKSEKTVDPEGLMNSTKTIEETKSINGRVVEQKKEVDD